MTRPIDPDNFPMKVKTQRLSVSVFLTPTEARALSEAANNYLPSKRKGALARAARAVDVAIQIMKVERR